MSVTPWYEQPFKVRIYQSGERWVGEAFSPDFSPDAPRFLPDFTTVQPTREQVASDVQQHISEWRTACRERALHKAARDAAELEEWL
jgi:hypothetical protein